MLLSENKSRSSAEVKAIAQQKIEELQQRIAQQQALLNSLKEITNLCHGDAHSECAIIDAFIKSRLIPNPPALLLTGSR